MINLKNVYLLLAKVIPMAIVNLCLLSLLNVTVSTFGLMLMHNQNVKAQYRHSNEANLEQLLRETKRAKTTAEIPHAQQSWSVAIEQHPMLTNCGNTTNIPVAGATDCTTAKVAAWNLLMTLFQTPNCLNPGCPAGSAITQGVSTCTPDPYIRPNGSPAIRWQVSWSWNCVAQDPNPIDPCCPPWNKNRLAEMMFYQGQGSISDPYTLIFKPTASFINQMQNYINYLNSLNSAMTHMTIEWRLHDRGNGTLPTTTGTFPQIGLGSSTTWNVGGNGSVTVAGPPIFSTPTAFPMQIGTWYNVYTIIYLQNGQRFFPEDCSTNEIFVRVQVMLRRSGKKESVLEFSDGKNVIERIPIEPR